MSSEAPRIPPLTTAEARARAEAEGMPSVMGDLNVFRVLLRHPTLARALHELIVVLLYNAKLDHRLRELVIMRIAWRTGSAYEWTQHWQVSLGFGLPAEDVLGVRDWPNHDGFGATDRAVLRATDETLETGTISEQTWQACSDALGGDAEQLLELVASIGNWRLFSALLRSLDIPLEEGTPPWPPDGAAPQP
jgi:alkylhydroperoxidase family enzyme